jgi:hypothetical protein
MGNGGYIVGYMGFGFLCVGVLIGFFTGRRSK